MLNKLKVMLFGGKPDHERRRTPRAGKVPAVGGHIGRQQLVMQITGPMPRELWDWFVLMGWREVNMKTNRRQVKMLPKAAFANIANANIGERETVYRQAIK